MKIIAINAGSSSLKYQLFEMPESKVICSGQAERIGINDSIFSMKINGEKIEEVMDLPNHKVVIDILLEWLLKYKAVENLNEIVGVGHRVVHGGESFSESVIITPEVKKEIENLSGFAPLHNPANLTGIEAFQEALPDVLEVAVFDTAFHQTMEPSTYMYATPYEWYEKYNIRKYGFHGTSHDYVSKRAAEFIGKPYNETKSIVLHLGNGASICAIKDGKSINTTMGFTPLAGIPMGTRSGDIDPAIIPFICAKENLSAQEVIDKLNNNSGFLGVSGVSSDARDLMAAVNEGNEQAKLAADIYARRIAEVIGAYIVDLGGVDIIAFTAGIGENAGDFRELILDNLVPLGVKYDKEYNWNLRGVEAMLTTDDSTMKIAVIPTDEELVIAEDTYNLYEKNNLM